MCLSRPQKLCNFLEWREYKIVYKRYASLFFITCVDRTDNELITLEVIHQFVEVLDRYFGNVVGFGLSVYYSMIYTPSLCDRKCGQGDLYIDNIHRPI
jgi:AP-1 complex subunit sigma 1/2